MALPALFQEQAKVGHHASGEKWFLQFFRLVPLAFGYSPMRWARQESNLHLLVTSIRLRGVKMTALREWREVIYVTFRELMPFH